MDDVILCRLLEDLYLCVCNAGTHDRVVAWFLEHLGREAVRDHTAELVCLALQGPDAARILQGLSRVPLDGLKPFRGIPTQLPGAPPVETEGWVSLAQLLGAGAADASYYVTRTGYTGEDGFEIYAPNPLGVRIWEELVGRLGVPPIGLGARDTLRLEKGYLLSGQDFDGRQTPFEVGYERVVRWDHPFLGDRALLEWKERSDYPRLQGIQLRGRGVLRPGQTVWRGDREVGFLTSGTFSPTLQVGIGLGYLDPDVSLRGERVTVEVRGNRLEAEVRPPPFA